MSTKLLRSGPARLFNSLVLHFAGTRYFPLYGVIEHHLKAATTHPLSDLGDEALSGPEMG